MSTSGGALRVTLVVRDLENSTLRPEEVAQALLALIASRDPSLLDQDAIFLQLLNATLLTAYGGGVDTAGGGQHDDSDVIAAYAPQVIAVAVLTVALFWVCLFLVVFKRRAIRARASAWGLSWRQRRSRVADASSAAPLRPERRADLRWRCPRKCRRRGSQGEDEGARSPLPKPEERVDIRLGSQEDCTKAMEFGSVDVPSHEGDEAPSPSPENRIDIRLGSLEHCTEAVEFGSVGVLPSRFEGSAAPSSSSSSASAAQSTPPSTGHSSASRGSYSPAYPPKAVATPEPPELAGYPMAMLCGFSSEGGRGLVGGAPSPPPAIPAIRRMAGDADVVVGAEGVEVPSSHPSPPVPPAAGAASRHSDAEGEATRREGRFSVAAFRPTLKAFQGPSSPSAGPLGTRRRASAPASADPMPRLPMSAWASGAGRPGASAIAEAPASVGWRGTVVAGVTRPIAAAGGAIARRISTPGRRPAATTPVASEDLRPGSAAQRWQQVRQNWQQWQRVQPAWRRPPEQPPPAAYDAVLPLVGNEVLAITQLERRLQDIRRLPSPDRQGAAEELVAEWLPERNPESGEERERVWRWLQNRKREVLDP